MHSKLHISSLSQILKEKGVRNIVIAPGSRNAPLTQVFYREFGDSCLSIVDERSAAYFALGLALESNQPVVIITTSGTAVLNLGPALAEAFHLGVPLIAVTADRPPEWIDQADNQTIRQKDIFRNNIKKSFELPVATTTKEDIWLTERTANEAFNLAMAEKKGPVHINVPLREPLYEDIPKAENTRLIEVVETADFVLNQKLCAKFSSAKNVLFLVGQKNYDKAFNNSLARLLKDQRISVSAEAISNLPDLKGICNLDLILATHKESEIPQPDLIIYLGGQVVSKRVKTYLRKLKNCEQWYVSKQANHVDTFKNVEVIIEANLNDFIQSISNETTPESISDFQDNYSKLHLASLNKLQAETTSLKYSDVAVFHQLGNLFTDNDIVFVGNSSVIRYYQLFKNNAGKVYANRGTSGIDGCLSTAAGIAASTTRTVYALLGDLTFLYDSNGLWNNNLPENLKIIVINNGGGGIFSLINSTPNKTVFDKFFQTKPKVDIGKICDAFFIHHYFCDSIESIHQQFAAFSAASTSLMEIQTPDKVSPAIFHNLIENLKR
jgi:2-succinyl-5-enolpyruvyl-6-hydroxy-3-cyclohexene-1-carboxylate synthase